jgi:3-hydroxybutyryl-CoA dehydrogenase
MERQVTRGSVEAGAVPPAMSRILHGTELKVAADVDLVIEAATENEGLKREIFSKVVPLLLRPEVLIATNTSSISITPSSASA